MNEKATTKATQTCRHLAGQLENLQCPYEKGVIHEMAQRGACAAKALARHFLRQQERSVIISG